MKSKTKTNRFNPVWLLFLSVLGAGFPVQGQSTESLAFLALGDSYTIGQGVAPQQRWPEQLARLLQSQGLNISSVDIVARTGWTSADLLSQLQRQPPDKKYQLVSLQIGVNNQFRGQSVNQYKQEFVDLLELAVFYAGGDSSQVIVLAIPDYGVTPFGSRFGAKRIAQQLQHFNQISRQISLAAGVTYIDIYPVSRQAGTDPSLIAADGLHPSSKMYRQWAQLCVQPVLALRLKH